MEWSPWEEFEVCERDVKRFLRAIGEDNDFYLKEKVAPPTFFFVFRENRPDHGIKNFKSMLHASQEFEISRLMRIGERVKYRTRIANKTSRKRESGEEIVFITYESEYFSVEGEELIARTKTTIALII